MDVDTLRIAAEVHEAAGADRRADESLESAFELQKTILDRSRYVPRDEGNTNRVIHACSVDTVCIH